MVFSPFLISDPGFKRGSFLTRSESLVHYPFYMSVSPLPTPELKSHWIDSFALEIVETLKKNGFVAYLVGGCVRDLLLGIIPKDFDIATDAKPKQVQRLIPRSFVIGRRFRLVLVKRGEHQYEVATFRRNVGPDEDPDAQEVGPDNLFGTPEEDASRRDFTLNSLFYDPIEDKIIDFCNGLKDIREGVIRMIGDPNERLTEDPIRILRGLRLAHKLGFTLEPELRRACLTHSKDLARSVLPRRREEFLKLLRLKDPVMAFHEASDFGVWAEICPTLNKVYLDPQQIKEFDSYFHRIHQHVSDPADPIYLFGYLVFCYFRTLKVPSIETPLRAMEILDDSELKSLMRDELGLFKYEQQIFAQALQLQSSIRKVEDFRRRGERRRMTIINHPAFPLALMMSQADYSLSPSQLFFWIEQRTLLTPSEPTQRVRSPRRRRPRSRNFNKNDSPQD